jgi:hypothetical protein
MQVFHRGRTVGFAAALAISLGSVVAASRRSEAAVHTNADTASTRARAVAATPGIIRYLDDSLRGRSGKLYTRFVTPDDRSAALPAFARLFGESSVKRPGVYSIENAGLTRPFSFIALHPFAEKQGARLGSYYLGYWPGERGATHSARYGNPAGFIEVTRDNADMRISEHFRLRDFLTHDQAGVWPKYLVLREDLVDKLELVIAELERSGVPVRHMTVMSGFRTPEYNAHGGHPGGRARLSRHMYGDASDVFVDNDGDGRMDDLNHDGRIDYRDAQVILAAAARVEAAHPDLVGGGGVYRATSEHGPFAHIDVRGKRARFGLVQ